MKRNRRKDESSSGSSGLAWGLVGFVFALLVTGPALSASDGATTTIAPLGADSEPLRLAARADDDISSIQTELGWFVRLVTQIQRRLGAIGLYHGAVDGRVDLSTADAIRDYQRSVGLPIDGEPTQDLLIHLESAAGEAQKPIHGLEETRQQQMEDADRALSEEFGNDWSEEHLLAALSDPTNSEHEMDEESLCFAQPSAVCLVAQALAAVPNIKRGDFRDWALGEIVTAQATITSPADAITTATAIGDPRSVVTSLGSIAMSLVETQRLVEAMETAERIPPGPVRADAFRDIAIAQAEVGNIIAAQGIVVRIDGTDARVPALSAIARAQYEADDLDACLKTLETAVDLAGSIRIAKHRDWAYGRLALVRLQTGDPDGALDTIERIANSAGTVAALAGLGIHYARSGQEVKSHALLARATRLLDHIDDPADRLQALGRVAIGQAENSHFDEAYTTVEQITFGYSHTYTLSVIAIAQAQAGEIEPALGLVSGIADERLRVQTLWTIATLLSADGDGGHASRLKRQALDIAHGITNTVDRLFVLSDLARAQAGQGDLTGAYRTLNDVLETIAPVENAWARARALGKAAATLAAIEQL